MTDMKLAIVPVIEAGSSADGTVVAIIGKAYQADQYICVDLAECKITREQIETMSRAAEPNFWKGIDIIADPIRTKAASDDAIDRMIAAVKSVGFGVEGE